LMQIIVADKNECILIIYIYVIVSVINLGVERLLLSITATRSVVHFTECFLSECATQAVQQSLLLRFCGHLFFIKRST